MIEIPENTYTKMGKKEKTREEQIKECETRHAIDKYVFCKGTNLGHEKADKLVEFKLSLDKKIGV